MALSFPSLALGFGAGLVVALGATMLFRSDGASRSRDVPARDDARQALDDDDEDALDDEARSGGVNLGATRATAPPAGTAAQLRAEVARLTGELAVERQRREQAEGKPIPFPPEVAERHTEKGLMTSVRAALDELKLGGDVTAIDCTENPCLASVRMQGKIDLERFLKAQALAPYAKDQPAYSSSGFPDGENVLVLGYSEPQTFTLGRDDPGREEKMEQHRTQRSAELERRSARVRAMFQAGVDELAPHAPPP